jgi:hypothetical protein
LLPTKRAKINWASISPEVKIKVKLFLCFNWASCHERVLGQWRYSSTHSLTSALEGRFTPRESSWYPLARRLRGPQSRSAHGCEGENSQPLPGLEPPINQLLAQRHVTQLFQYPPERNRLVRFGLCTVPSSKNRFV